MENVKLLKTATGCLAGVAAWVSARLGILSPVLTVLLAMMAADYLSGMAASKSEAIDHPGDANYGWNSRKGAKGIIKKVGYLCVIAAAMVADFIFLRVAAEAGMQVGAMAFFGLLVAVWYLLNELLSIIENAGRMGAPVPVWLARYIAALKNKIDSEEGGSYEDVTKRG